MMRMGIVAVFLFSLIASDVGAAVGLSVEDGDAVHHLYVLDKSEFQKRIDSFNRDLKARKLPYVIENCDTIIDIPLGSANHFYGAACASENKGQKNHVMICTNIMTDTDFKIEVKDKRDFTLNRLVSFTVTNCIH